jgi:hypothetical protein
MSTQFPLAYAEVQIALTDAATRAQVRIPNDLWHVVLFYTVGEVTREASSRRGIDYEPYLYKTGLFERAWPALRKPIESVLPELVSGHMPLDEAARRLVLSLR